MNPNYLTRAELADFGRYSATQVANGKVSGMLAAQIASISAAIAEASEELAEADRLQVELRAAAMAATEAAQEKRLKLLKLLQGLKYLMRGLNSPAHEYDAVGFDPPVLGRRPVIPLTPFELAATGYSNGVNKLTFTGNNAPGRVVFLVEAKTGDSPQYVIIGTTKSQRFKHEGVKPGVPIQYRVRAQAARGQISACSNEAAVYMLE
jgi:hypothetical protein